MKRQYTTPVVEKVVFDYKVQTISTTPCFELISNEHAPGDPSTTCTGGTPVSLGWNDPQTVVGGG